MVALGDHRVAVYGEPIETAVAALRFLAAAVFAATSGAAWLGLRRLQRLPPAAAATRPAPRVSVIVAARDEEARIATTLQRLLAQTGVDLEVVVVDDRSSDATPDILRAAADTHPALRILRVDDLPPGWLGKCHACDVGARAATGDWLLFVDGDSWLGPDVVARAVTAARHADAAHVTLMASMARASLLGRALVLLLSVGFLQRVAAINADRGWTYVGAGAFNLARRDAYEAIGGHAGLRLEVIEDMHLAAAIRRRGYRSRVFLANQDCVVDWVADLPSFFAVLEKNLFAVVRFDTARAALTTVGSLALWTAAITAPLAFGVASVAAALGLASLALPTTALARRSGLPLLPALLAPLLVPVVSLAMANSAVATLRRGGVRWRGTFHALAELRAQVVSRRR